MLGKTAGGLFWMFRYIERSESTARLVDAGFRIALTRASDAGDEWASILNAAGASAAYHEHHDSVSEAGVIDFLLRDRRNPSSVLSVIEAARMNARLVRTALTREVWEATNVCWMTLCEALARPVGVRDLPALLEVIRQQSALIRGALHGTMLRNEIYNFARIGTFMERADNTARILDVKYYVLLPSVSLVGSSLDNVQWETILRSVSAHTAFRWLNGSDVSPISIADFLILDGRLPRSLLFCSAKLAGNLGYLAADCEAQPESKRMADAALTKLKEASIRTIFDSGLHEFIQNFLRENIALGNQIAVDFQFEAKQ